MICLSYVHVGQFWYFLEEWINFSEQRSMLKCDAGVAAH